MSKTVTIIVMLICILFGILIGYFAKTIVVSIEDNKNSIPYQKHPRKTIVVKIETSQQEMLFNQMRKFANDKGFAIRIASTSPNGTDYIVEMWREDVKVIALNSFEPGMFRIAFFDTESRRPALELTIDSLISDLKSILDEIPNITINEEE